MKEEKIILSTFSMDEFVYQITKSVVEGIIDIRKEESPPQVKVYLTRKQAYTKLGITGPTLDKMVEKGILCKIGYGRGARFRYNDVENVYENMDKYYSKRK